jgi:hypothetical protein
MGRCTALRGRGSLGASFGYVELAAQQGRALRPEICPGEQRRHVADEGAGRAHMADRDDWHPAPARGVDAGSPDSSAQLGVRECGNRYRR